MLVLLKIQGHWWRRPLKSERLIERSVLGNADEVPELADQPAGLFNAWPTGGGGLEGFTASSVGRTTTWDPALYEGHDPDPQPCEAPAEGYHRTAT